MKFGVVFFGALFMVGGFWLSAKFSKLIGGIIIVWVFLAMLYGAPIETLITIGVVALIFLAVRQSNKQANIPDVDAEEKQETPQTPIDYIHTEPPPIEEKEQPKMELDVGKLADGLIDKIKDEFGLDENGEITLESAAREIQTISTDDGMFVGECINGIPNGNGAITSSSGRSYRGEWLNGKWHGFGTMTFSGGDIYEGMFENGKMHGKGKLSYANGTYYEGDFLRGDMQGMGTLYAGNGRIFAGQFANGSPNGRVTISIPDGQLYIGEVKDGIPHGKGKVVVDGKLQYDGYWLNGKPVGGSMLNETAASIPAPAAAPDSPDELRKYKQLLDDGIITQEDYKAKKKQLLGV